MKTSKQIGINAKRTVIGLALAFGGAQLGGCVSVPGVGVPGADTLKNSKTGQAVGGKISQQRAKFAELCAKPEEELSRLQEMSCKAAGLAGAAGRKVKEIGGNVDDAVSGAISGDKPADPAVQ